MSEGPIGSSLSSSSFFNMFAFGTWTDDGSCRADVLNESCLNLSEFSPDTPLALDRDAFQRSLKRFILQVQEAARVNI